MPHYRAYPLDDSGHFIGATDFEAVDDSDALQVVESLTPQSSFEIWCGKRLVGLLRRNDVANNAPPSSRSAT